MPLSSTPDVVFNALNWVDQNLSFFAPSSEESPPKDSELQAWAELALASLLWERNKPDIALPSMDRVRSFLMTLAGDSWFWHRAVRTPGDFLPICDVIAATRGPASGPQLHALQEVISCGALDGIDRTMVSRLEVRLSIEWAGLQTNAPTLEEIGCCCSKPPLPMFASSDDCYTLTHLVMFATDFGHRPPPSGGGLSDTIYLARILSSYIVRYVSEGNLDLLIELLLSWQCLRLPQTTLTRLAWRFFVGHQEADGSFHRRVAKPDSAPQTSPTPAVLSSAPAPDRAWFSERYHTTLLVVMAGGLPDIQSAISGINDAMLDTKTNKRQHVMAEDVIESARVSATAAWRWVSDEADALARDDSIEHAGYSLLIWWLWRALVGRDNIYSDSPPENLLRRSRAFDMSSYFTVGRGSLTLNIITAGLVRRFDANNADADAFLQHISSILRKSESEDSAEELALCEKKVILNALGFEHNPYRSAYEEVISAAKQCAFGFERACIDDLLLRIESLTRYGMSNTEMKSSDVWLKDLLQGLADDAFRKYDWPLACRCVRAMGYLNFISQETSKDYMTFFVLHQLPGGAFAYLGPDSRALLSESSAYKSLDEINLSITVEALWTMAELATGGKWKLFESLGQLSVARQ